MRSEVSWIDRVGTGLLGIMPRPRGGDWLDGESRFLAKAGVNMVVSLLTADEVSELELEDEERLCGDCGLRFISFPIPDRGVPFSMPDAGRIVLEELWAEKAVAVHASPDQVACLSVSPGQPPCLGEPGIRSAKADGLSLHDTRYKEPWHGNQARESYHLSLDDFP